MNTNNNTDTHIEVHASCGKKWTTCKTCKIRHPWTMQLNCTINSAQNPPTSSDGMSRCMRSTQHIMQGRSRYTKQNAVFACMASTKLKRLLPHTTQQAKCRLRLHGFFQAQATSPMHASGTKSIDIYIYICIYICRTMHIYIHVCLHICRYIYIYTYMGGEEAIAL